MPPTTRKGLSSLKQLRVQLDDLKSSFDDIWSFIQKFSDETTGTQVEVRLERIDDLWERFSENLVELKSHEYFEDEESYYSKLRKHLSDRYYEAKTFLLDKSKALRVSSELEQSAHEQSMSGVVGHVRLPQINLQSFKGDIDDWLSFRDLFTSLIHWRTDLPEVEKFHYLKGCLQGEPKSLIDPLKITKANYQIAWDILVKRYNNNKLLKKKQVQSFFKLPTLSKESVVELRYLVDGFDRVVQTLDQIVEPAEYKDLLLVNLLTMRLDPSTRRAWEEYSANKEMDLLTDLTEFLRQRMQVLESLPSRQTDNKIIHQQQPPPKPKASAIKASYNSIQSSGGRCVACKDNHLLYQCSAFQRLSVVDRDSLLKSQGLCRNCFRSGHQAKDCQSKFSCRICKNRHHTLVCFKSEKDHTVTVAAIAGGNHHSNSKESQGSSGSNSIQLANVAATDVSVCGTSNQLTSQVLLATAVVIVEDDVGSRYHARALLDSGSESNFVSERLTQRMKVIRNKVDVSVLGIGQGATKVKHTVQAVIRSRTSDFSRDMRFLVLPKVTANLPTTSINTEGWILPNGIELADPAFFTSKEVDMVLGIEAFFEFFESGRRITIGKHLPSLTDSVFGWVVCGGCSTPIKSLQVNCHFSTSEDLEKLMARFWSCEEVEFTDVYSLEEKKCEELFQRGVQRGPEGRYTVPLPKNEDVLPNLGESRDIAFRRLLGTERRLARDANLREQYIGFMDEYLKLGHMRKVEETTEGPVKRCYLPHHPVVKEASTTTKVRVVFDASCKTSSGVSLNDVLLVGPVVQEDLRSIILRSRMNQILLVSDVEKMFRQILTWLKDRPLQSVLFRFSPDEEVAVYELNTVTYGTKPAPFLATRTLRQLAADEEDRFPLAARAIREDVYMDDVITGTDEVDAAISLRNQLIEMMLCGGFKLRKWACNVPKVLEGVPEENLALRDPKGINLDSDQSVKTLGLTWMPITDTLRFQFTVPPIEPGVPLTKRRILSLIATLFDPLGLIGATTSSTKIFMQQLWTLQDETGNRLHWDQPVPLMVGENWRKFHEKLPLLYEIRVDRCVIIPKAVLVEIHCFSDASNKAYGGCVYIRSQDSSGIIKVRLLSSRSKVAPLRCQSIPRLELCGALLSAQLYEKVKDSTRLAVQTFFWTDSTCVLRWIESTPATWTTFVANRVAKIQTLTEGWQWRHVPGTDNPADLISRGVSPEDIVDNELWWEGPNWLKEAPEAWPGAVEEIPEAGEEERRRTVVACTVSPVAEFNEVYLSKFGSYSDLVRRTAYWLRLMKLLRIPAASRPANEFLNAAELKAAENAVLRNVQREVFAEEWKALSKGEFVSRKSPLRWFHPFVCKDGLIRVGGRLKNSEELESTKHPPVLPARHQLTRLILRCFHERLLHAGPQLLLGAVRLQFWPLGGRNVAREIVHRCVKCFRTKPSTMQQFMGELPSSRVNVSRPFTKTGVDYFGPVYIRPAPRRAAVKAYVSVFICLCTKAVHLELVSDLSTDRFLQALRRFVSRRGKCSDIYSDNGTNFVGARNKLAELYSLLSDRTHRDRVTSELAKDGIQWHFNPPSAPHFGGLWEAAVRSAKNHLIKVIGETPASSEDFATLLIQVEACLNSRPLTPMSDDPNDLEPLTPAHFLVGSSLQALPDPEFTTIPPNRLNHYQLMQQKLQHFWIRWRREYLSQLQARTKRWKPAVLVEVGKLVVIKDDNLPPMRWKMGRIVAIHPGEDNVVRVVTLKTATGELKRPVEKNCMLPLSNSQEENQIDATLS
ncbi:uncharacterized protein LOC135707260 [Ochlerotatus camptorhynchus]|uniref:uncharacterized protein LOC135707260 n=1 Tax=Ochlerotatus camptorhynchus TaxID=644619 RepID=UPI0031DE867B